MFSPFQLLILAFAGMVAGLPMPGEAFGGLFMGSAAAWVVALCLWLRAKWRARRRTRARAEQRARSAQRKRAAREAPRKWVVVDGSNVLYWQDETPSLTAVTAVLNEVQRAGMTPLVWFDANVGYKVGTSYMNPADLARALGVSRKQVRVAPKGSPADPLLLDEAAKLGTGVVTNDRYRDWVESYPSVAQPGVLVHGRLQDGAVTLDWPEGRAA